jgi:hypothetical protein
MTSRSERARQRAAWRARREAELVDHLILIRGLIDELAQDGRWTLETGRTIAGYLDDIARDAGLTDAYARRRPS